MIDVPVGTVVYNENGHVLKDMSRANELFLVAR